MPYDWASAAAIHAVTYNQQELTRAESRIHQLLPDGRAVPFCTYNSLGYREEVRQQMEVGR